MGHVLYFVMVALFGTHGMCAINAQQTTCTVTPSPAEEGDQVIIVCEFPSDYSGETFNVHLFKTTVDRSGQASEKLILTYTKVPEKPARYEYHEDGYRVTSDDSTKMTVVIDSIILEQAGNYSCKMLRVRGEDVRYCSLEVKAKAPQTGCEAKRVSEGEIAEIVCHFNTDLLRGRRHFMLQRQSQFGVLEENAVICQRRNENFKTCYSPPNDCVKKADRQRYITCHSDHKKYYVDTSSVTPSTVTVVVLNVSPQSKGTYVCRPVSPIQGQLNSCQLDVSATVHGEAKVTDPHMIAGWTVAAVLALFVVLAVCIFFTPMHRRKKQRKRPPPSTLDEANGGPQIEDSKEERLRSQSSRSTENPNPPFRGSRHSIFFRRHLGASQLRSSNADSGRFSGGCGGSTADGPEGDEDETKEKLNPVQEDSN